MKRNSVPILAAALALIATSSVCFHHGLTSPPGYPRSSDSNETSGGHLYVADSPPGVARDSLEAFLHQRCQREGIPLEVMETSHPAPRLPAQFRREIDGTWPKVISKLQERYGYVPVYPKDSTEPAQRPTRIVQIGRFLYLGGDESEIAALKTLVDGSAEERLSALDIFADEDDRATSIFLDLERRDPEAQVRIEAARKLQFHPTEQAIHGLIETLADEDEAVQTTARASLVWIGDEKVLLALRVAAESQNPSIAEQAQAILHENLQHH